MFDLWFDSASLCCCVFLVDKKLKIRKVGLTTSVTWDWKFYPTNPSLPPPPPPGHLNFWKISVQIPPSPSQIDVQMPPPRGNKPLYLKNGQCKTQTVDCRLRTRGKMQSDGKMQTADCRLQTEGKMQARCKMQKGEICVTALSKRLTDISYTPGPDFPSVT